MNKKNYSTFPSGWEITTYDLKELLYLARQLAAEGKHEVALAVLHNRCLHTPEGKLALARLYRDSAQLSLGTKERYQRAERLLLELEQDFDIPDICLDLSKLYNRTHEELLSRAYLLRAARLGAALPEDPLNSTLRFLKESLDINSVFANLYASFTMGCELAKITDDPEAIRFSLWLLQIVAESEETRYSPIASLFLAEHYADGKNQDKELFRKYAALSEKKGYPAVLRNPNKHH